MAHPGMTRGNQDLRAEGPDFVFRTVRMHGFLPQTGYVAVDDPPVSSETNPSSDELIESHMALVGHVVRETMVRIPAHVNRDDLTSAGLTALVQAAQGFDAERGVPFARYAATRIRGAILDELRSIDWASRSVRRRARDLDETRNRLCRQPRPRAERRRGGQRPRVSPPTRSLPTTTTSPAPRSSPSTGRRTTRTPRPWPAPRPARSRWSSTARSSPTWSRPWPSCPSGCASSSRSTSWPSARWPRSPSSWASPSPACRRCAPRPSSSSRTRSTPSCQPELVSAPARPDGCAARRREAYFAAVAARHAVGARQVQPRVRGFQATA